MKSTPDFFKCLLKSVESRHACSLILEGFSEREDHQFSYPHGKTITK